MTGAATTPTSFPRFTNASSNVGDRHGTVPGPGSPRTAAPRAQWVNPGNGAALAVVPIGTEDDQQHRSFGVFYLPPAGDIWVLRPGLTGYLEPADGDTEHLIALRNDAFKKAVAHAREFLYGPEGVAQ